MNNPNFEKEVNIINNLNFKHLESVKCGELLATKLFYAKKKMPFVSVLKNLASVFLNSHIYKESGSDYNAIFFFTPSYSGRIDHFNDFISVASCVGNPVIFNGNKQKKRINFSRIIGLFYWFIWLLEIMKTGFGLNNSMQLCNIMLQAFYTLEEVKCFKFNKEKTKLAVTFCDVHPCDYLITKYFNELGIKTATLQHAVFYHGIQWYCYRFSHSDYFFATNEYSKSEAKKSGYLGEVKVVGSMKAINMSNFNNNSNNKSTKNTFGVALCGPTFIEQNTTLLNYSKYIQAKYGFGIKIRLHPTLKFDEYKEKFDLLKNVSISKESINEFADSCDFVILGATNMFAELITFNTAAFRVISDNVADIYDGIDDFYFKTPKELDELISIISDKENFQKALVRVKKYLSPEGNIKELYKKTFKDITK